MYKLTLEPKSKKYILKNQSIYWYPLKLTLRGQLISINIANNKSLNIVRKFWSGRRIAATYPLDENNSLFFYLGIQGNIHIFNTFKEKPLFIDEGCLSYIFSEIEVREILDKFEKKGSIKISENNQGAENLCLKLFEQLFSSEWIIKFYKLENSGKYGTEQISPHPIVHFLNFTKKETFSRSYYKELFLYLLKRDFLVHWLNLEDVSQEEQSEILSDCIKISMSNVKNREDLTIFIKSFILEIFEKYEFFSISYLASQCGSAHSIFKLLMDQLHSLLPEKEKKYIESGYSLFQPKIMIRSIELHFIQASMSRIEAKILKHSLKIIFNEVSYHEAIFSRRYSKRYTKRYRFLCKIILPYLIDYTELSNEIYILGSAIRTILSKSRSNPIVEEMWVKELGLQIVTPPPFEDDTIISISHIWLIPSGAYKNFYDKNILAKVIYLNIACDYLVFKNGEFEFTFDFSREMQYAYSILNHKLAINHNFSQFSNYQDQQNVG